MKGYALCVLSLCGLISCNDDRPRAERHREVPSTMPATALPNTHTLPLAEEWFVGTQQPYLIQVGDTLSVRFFYEPRLDDTLKVRPDGQISLTPVDDVPAAGLTAQQLDEELTRRFSHIINKPDLSVIVREAAAQRAYVGGEVAQPGVVEISTNTSVLSGIIGRGGPAVSAALENVVLIRRGEGNVAYVTRLNVNEMISKGNGDVLLHPYDVVYVPRTIITELDIFVEQYINRIVPRFLGFQFLYQLNPEVQVENSRGFNQLFPQSRIIQ